MKLLLTISTLLTAATALPVLSPRDDEPFVGNGILNVITSENEQVGCLDEAMAFTTDTSSCATYNIVKNTYVVPYWGTTQISYDISTSAGPCGDPFQEGSEYQEGGNRILLCGAGSDADNSYWGVSISQSFTIPSLVLKSSTAAYPGKRKIQNYSEYFFVSC